jgi:hypothetical protein
MNLPQFNLDRYDPITLLRAFGDSRLIERGTEVYHLLDYGGDEFEIHYPECDAAPVPTQILSTAQRACTDIREIDNLVQVNCKKEAGRSELDPRNFMLHIGYMKAYPNRIQIRYWGIVVNTEWEAEFVWSKDKGWSPVNFEP